MWLYAYRVCAPALVVMLRDCSVAPLATTPTRPSLARRPGPCDPPASCLATEEDRERRLAEMMGNASEHEQQRTQRLARAREEEAREDDKVVSHTDAHRGADAFKAAASRDVYASMAASGSLEARVGSRRHYSNR